MNLRSRWLGFAGVGLLLVSCKMAVPPPPGETAAILPPVASLPPPLQAPDEEAGLKREKAAAALIDRGRTLMEDGRIDPAMRLFEQALSLSPHYGPGYFYLAEAWLAKADWSQARELHRQAELYLDAVAPWEARLAEQRRRVERAAAAGEP
ncbi:MAG: tetratricopeptide repeat protein [Desulfosarcina sp.]|nr:tetratricopeptide repeat protein [Desulfobacterales bacterium]